MDRYWTKRKFANYIASVAKHACPIDENLQKDIDSFKTCR